VSGERKMRLLAWGEKEGKKKALRECRSYYKEFATGIRSGHKDGFILGVGVGLSATGSGGVY
jgi:hypothetical protein